MLRFLDITAHITFIIIIVILGFYGDNGKEHAKYWLTSYHGHSMLTGPCCWHLAHSSQLGFPVARRHFVAESRLQHDSLHLTYRH